MTIRVGADHETCDNPGLENSSVYYADFEVFDRFGGLLYKITAEVDDVYSNGLDGIEVFWNGYFGSSLAQSGAYTCKLVLRSCYPVFGFTNCGWNCSDPFVQGDVCGNSQEEIYSLILNVIT